MAKTYPDHPYASVLPLLGQRELSELAADIQGRGLLMPIVLLDGKILDGRNRYRACLSAGVEPAFREFNGDGDPIDYIVSVNVRRRHLTTAQREMVAARLATMPRGDVSRFSQQTSQTAKRQNGTKTVAQAAKELEVSPRNVARAKEVLRTAPTEDIKAIERGEKKVGTVARETREKIAAKERRLDKTGFPIPEPILEDWDRTAANAKNWMQTVSELRSSIKKSLEDQDVGLVEIDNGILAELNNVYGELKCVQPYAVCTSCQGIQKKKCALCKHRGFISTFGWNSYVSKEDKSMREKMK